MAHFHNVDATFSDTHTHMPTDADYTEHVVWPYGTSCLKKHPKHFLAISDNFENFHVELASQPMLS